MRVFDGAAKIFAAMIVFVGLPYTAFVTRGSRADLFLQFGHRDRFFCRFLRLSLRDLRQIDFVADRTYEGAIGRQLEQTPFGAHVHVSR